MLHHKPLLPVILLWITLPGFPQDTVFVQPDSMPVSEVIIDGDTVYVTELEEAVIQPRTRNAAVRDYRQYQRLVYNVKKVYPYAKIAGKKYAEVIIHLESLPSGKEQREYIKKVEEEILKDYELELRELTVTQGRILIKLIDRETSFTSYEVVKELRGSIQAAFWQAIARLFGSNLKTEFDPDGEDRVLNEIMILMEKGQL